MHSWHGLSWILDLAAPLLPPSLPPHLHGRVFNVSSTLQGECAISCCVIYVLNARINIAAWPGQVGTPELSIPCAYITTTPRTIH